MGKDLYPTTDQEFVAALVATLMQGPELSTGVQH
jgi:hypothetical protein